MSVHADCRVTTRIRNSSRTFIKAAVWPEPRQTTQREAAGARRYSQLKHPCSQTQGQSSGLINNNLLGKVHLRQRRCQSVPSWRSAMVWWWEPSWPAAYGRITRLRGRPTALTGTASVRKLNLRKGETLRQNQRSLWFGMIVVLV